MNKPLLIVTVIAAVPACALQEPDQGGVPGTDMFACTGQESATRAASALPARAAAQAEPQRGSVAGPGYVPSQGATASGRAMAAALAHDERAARVKENRQGACPRGEMPDASE